MRIFIAVLCLSLSSTWAIAKTRVYIETPRSDAEIICPWVTMSVSPTWPQAQQAMMLGRCPPQATPK